MEVVIRVGDPRMDFDEKFAYFCFAYVAELKIVNFVSGELTFELSLVRDKIALYKSLAEMDGRLMKQLPKRKEYFKVSKESSEKSIRLLKKHLYAKCYGHYNSDENSTWD